ncbi:MAG: aminopeptidase N [Gemmatimonadota bacterium]
MIAAMTSAGAQSADLAASRRNGADSLLQPGVSRQLASHRAATISSVRYDLMFDLTSPDSATGRAEVRFARTRQGGDAIFDFRGRGLHGGSVNGRAVAVLDFDGSHIVIADSLLVTGENVVELRFTAAIAPAGASIIRVTDPSDSATYVYTLLVPSDAQQLFPSFDQPDLKARVSLTLLTPPHWKAVSNAEKQLSDSTSRGLVHVFRETEPISTYLIAFAAGPWVELRAAGSRLPISLYARRSRAREVDADSIILINDRALTWLEEYFGSRYPFHKLDLVLAPAFPFGGMEHPGAIFYSEERFVFRERPTTPQRQSRTATIYHEIAHQWFGDLVTMEWFDDLWLKEGFATYMAARMQDALDPAAESWKQFYLRNKPAAYAVDASEGTTPVWQQLANLDQAKSNYGAIVYNKAPSILKQLNYMVGDSAFRAGVQLFLRRHSFANATWRDLLDAIGTAAGRSLSSWGESYILRPGLPVVEQRIDVRDGRLSSLVLVQRPARALSGRGAWPLRIEVVAGDENGETSHIPLTVSADSTVVADLQGRPAPAFVFANGGDQAYALVILDPRSTTWLEENISRVKDPLLRSMLWGALWDLVRQAALSPTRFIALALRELPAERDEQLAAAILARLSRASSAYLSDVQRTGLLPDIERMLMAGTSDSSRAYGTRKAHLDTFIRIAATRQGITLLDALLDSATAAGEPLRAPTRWATVTRLVALDAPTAQVRLEAETRRDSTAEGARRAFVAKAAQPLAAVKESYFTRYFADATLNEDWATSSLDAFNAIEQQLLTRPFLTTALDSLEWVQKNRRIFYLGAWIGAFVEGQTEEEALEIVRRALARPDLPRDIRSKILQAADELERTVRIRRAFGVNAVGSRAEPNTIRVRS